MSFIYSWVRNITIFVIFTTVIDSFLGSSRYKQFINLITGFILMLIVVSPILQVLHLEDKLDYNILTNLNEAETQDINDQLQYIEESQVTSVIQKYKSLIQDQVEELMNREGYTLTKSTIELNEDEASKEFSQIISLDIQVKKSTTTEDNTKNAKSIENVTIDDIEINKEQEVKESEDNQTEDEINLQHIISDFYLIDDSQVNIHIQ